MKSRERLAEALVIKLDENSLGDQCFLLSMKINNNSNNNVFSPKTKMNSIK